MMDHDAINAVINAAHEATARHGINVRGGKRYSQVTTRVELFRRNFIGWGMETEIIHLGLAKGEPIIVRARILDPEGRIKGTGHASEVIGSSSVNSTSALENAETSAIGRALSSIGLHGGEYASLNEVEGAERKQAALNDDLAHAPDTALHQNLIPECRAILGGSTTHPSALKAAWQTVQSKCKQAGLSQMPPELTAYKDELKAQMDAKVKEDAEAFQ